MDAERVEARTIVAEWLGLQAFAQHAGLHVRLSEARQRFVLEHRGVEIAAYPTMREISSEISGYLARRKEQGLS
jgi:hypothetical protein